MFEREGPTARVAAPMVSTALPYTVFSVRYYVDTETMLTPIACSTRMAIKTTILLAAPATPHPIIYNYNTA